MVVVGDEGQKMFDTLTFDSERDKQDVEALKIKFEERCKPAVNLAYQDNVFGTRDQKPDGKFDNWLTDLRLLAKQCDFRDMEDRMLLTRIILGTKGKDLQKQLIKDNLSYEHVIGVCRTHEKSKEQYERIQVKTDVSTSAREQEVCALREPAARRNTKCQQCDYEAHRDEVCPARSKICRKCGKQDHFASLLDQSYDSASWKA